MVDANSTVPGGAEASYMFAIWNLVIRPPRASYDTAQLGPNEFEIGTGIRGQRRDVRLRTQRGLYLECSHFIPKLKERRKEWQKMPVVIYCHGNASSRLEAGSLVAKLLERNISLFCFDWAGCGISDGEYVSLGWHERDDLATVISHIRENENNGPIGIWGRSMGAVSALMHADRDPTIAGLCLDSPFSSLRELIEEIAESDRIVIPVPSWLVNGILSLIRMRVQALAGFDIEDLVPANHGPRSVVPALFMHGKQDTFVLPRHSQRLYNNYAGDKEMMIFDGDHNNERGTAVIDRGVAFLCRAFRRYELEFMVSQHLADVHSSSPTQDGPHRIPHLPRPSSHRQALGEITNQQGPGARANEVEAMEKHLSFGMNSDDSTTDGGSATPSPTNSSSSSDNSRRAPPRKFASSLANRRTPSPTRQLAAAPRREGPLTNKVYPTTWKTPGEELVNLTPRGGRQTPRGSSRGAENRRPRSKGPSFRGSSGLRGMFQALGARGGA